jgi:hypothetical protein
VFHSIGVLLVLIIRSVRLNNTIDSVNGACDSVTGNEFGKIPVVVSFFLLSTLCRLSSLPIQIVHRHAKVVSHAV